MRYLIFGLLLFINIQVFSQNLDYSKFDGDPVNINQTVRLEEPYIYDYRVSAKKGKDSLLYLPINQSSPEKILTEKYKEWLVTDSLNFIKLDYRFTYRVEGRLVAIIRYQLFEDSLARTPMVITSINRENEWVENPTAISKDIRLIIKTFPIWLFWEFYSKKDRPNYPEINRLKATTRDKDGLLNVDRLAQVIRENQSALKKYTDKELY